MNSENQRVINNQTKFFNHLAVAIALMAFLTIPMGMRGQAPVGTTLWSETWQGGTNGETPSDYGFEGTTVYGDATLTYAQDDSGTKLYDANLATGTSPELLLKSGNKTWTISNIPTGSATGMTLSFKANYDRTVVSSATTGITIGTKSFSDNTVTYPITVASNVSTFTLVFTNTNSSNVRIDDIALVVTTAGGGSNLEDNDLALNPTSLPLDLYASASNHTGSITYTTSSTGAISVTGGTGYVTTDIDEINQTITVTPVAVTPSAQTITVSQVADNTYAAGSKTFTVTVADNTPSVNVTYHANGGTGENIVTTPHQGSDYTVAANTFTYTGHSFTKWTTNENGSGDEYQPGDVINNIQADIDLYAQWEESNAVVDVLNKTFTGVSSNFTAWSGKTGTSGAVYAGRSGGNNNSIQLNNTSPSGIVSTTSGGNVKKVVIDWNSNTSNGRTLNIYGKNTAYTGSAQLYDNTEQGELLGTIVKGTSTELDISGSYSYIGIKATNTSFYLNEIQITWETGGTPAPEFEISNNNEIAYNASSGSFNFTVNNSVQGGYTTVDENVAWISNATVNNGNTVNYETETNPAVAPREGVITLTYHYGEETKTHDVTVTQAGNPDAVNDISEITQAAAYTVKGTVVATNSRGFIMGDGTGYVYYYKGDDTGKSVGDKVKVSGTTSDTYGHILQFTSAATVETATTSNYNDTPTATTITTVPDYTQNLHLSTYFEFEGALTKETSGNNTYYEVSLGGTPVQISYPTTAQGTALDALVNKTVHVKGYFSGINSSSKFTVMMESIEESTNPAVIPASYSIEVDSEGVIDAVLTVQYPNITTVAADVEYYESNGTTTATYSWFVAEINSDDNVEYTVEENDSQNNRTAYFKVYALVGNDYVYSELITVTQSAPAATYSLVTGVDQIVSGKHFIIASGTSTNNNVKAMGAQAANNRSSVAVTFSGNKIKETENVREVIINGPDKDNHYIIYDPIADGTYAAGYLYAAGTSESTNYLKKQSFNDNKGVWTISINDDNEAIITSLTTTTSKKTIRYNSSSSGGIFSCYGSSNQAPVYLYVKDDNSTYDFYKDIVGYGTSNDKWCLIASPVTTDINPTSVDNLINAEGYDLYRFNQSNNATQWENYKNFTSTFNIEPGHGYLYANKANTTLHFSGIPNTSGSDTVTYDANATLKGYNLIGNPFGTVAYVTGDKAFYIMNEDGDGFIASTVRSVNPMEGIFVVAGENETTVTFSQTAPSNANNNNTSSVVMNLTQNRGSVVDRAIVRFGSNSSLPKFQLFENSTKLYIAQDGKDYAIVSAEAQGEMPVNFKAAVDGSYTISVATEGIEANYLHLIDNITGMDVDLLQTPSYTFNARQNDYASRFRLVFSANSTNESNSDNFAFISNGQIILTNVDNDATVQVIDALGRMIVSTNANNHVYTDNMAPGVYVLRLVNGNDVKTQKIVVK